MCFWCATKNPQDTRYLQGQKTAYQDPLDFNIRGLIAETHDTDCIDTADSRLPWRRTSARVSFYNPQMRCWSTSYGVSTLLYTLDVHRSLLSSVYLPQHAIHACIMAFVHPSGKHCSKPTEKAGPVVTRLRDTRNLEVGGTCKWEKTTKYNNHTMKPSSWGL